MKTIIRSGLLFITLSAAAFADQPVIRVVASSDLRLVVVDSSKATPARDALHRAFAESLGQAVGEACGSPVSVRVKCLSADSAAFGLSNGGCHVVLAIGKSLPRSLALSGLSRLNAPLGADKGKREAFLVFSNEDEGLQKLLQKSFVAAITNRHFLDALEGELAAVPDPAMGRALASTGP